jgi:rhomboid protease GluP
MLLVTFINGLKPEYQGAFDPQNLFDLGALWGNYVLDSGEWWRLLTSMFLHGSIIHYISNMIIGVLALSSALERLIGGFKFVVIYFGGGLLAGLVIIFFNPNALTIGASGAIFAALGSLLWITLYRPDKLTTSDVQTIRTLIVLNIVFTLLVPGISIAGHLGGISAGFLISYLIIERNVFKVIN